ncbi:hypothetical protein BH09VER1_BH09VER1_19450 [soil metagenome]
MNARSDALPKPRRRLTRVRLILAVLLLAALWAIHPFVLSHLLRFSLVQAASRAGLTLEVGKIESNLARPFIFNDIEFRAKAPSNLRTAAKIHRVEVAMNWPWQAFFGSKRLFRSVAVDEMSGVFDFRPSVLPSKGSSEPTEDRERDQTASIFQFLPEAGSLKGGNMEFIFGQQSYYFQDVSADFSEDKLGHFKTDGAEIHVGNFHESLGSLQAVTAWKEGSFTLADLDVREGVKIENLEVHLTRPGGVGVAMKGEIFGGWVRADVSFEGDKGALAIDAAVSAAGVQAAPLADLFGIPGKMEGVLREGRLTFRGVPDHFLDGEVSLRLAADGFRWNERGWESLTVGANMIHRRLAISDFALKQKDNSLTANGEVSLGENWQDLAKAPFQLNVESSVNDLGALAGLFGPPFQDLSGRMSLSSSVTGHIGKLDGFLILEASGMKYRKHPVESGRLDVTFAGNEAQVTQCEFWSGSDYARGKGSIQLSAPYTYSGDIQGRASDIAAYLSLVSGSTSRVYAGKADLRWQGDGNFSSHSGAFNIALDKFISVRTPSGLTGRFAGTYSPQNIYFSGFELQQGPLLFSTQATLASSGIRFTNSLLRSGKNEIASGEFYLPVDPFALLAGKSLGDSVDLGKPVYGSVTSRGFVSVRDLLRLGGNDLPAEGSVSLEARAAGTLANLALDAKLEGRGVGLHLDDSQNLTSHLEAVVHTADGRADLSGTLDTRGLSPVTWKAQGPFGLFKSPDGTLRFARAEGEISGQADFPKSDLEILRPLMPGFRRLSGAVSGTVSASGTLGKPLFGGSLTLSGGTYEPFPRFPVLTSLAGDVKLDSTSATLEKLTGDIGGGLFELKGGVSFADFSNWHYDFTLGGSKILLFRDPAFKVRANVDFVGDGNSSDGLLKGTISFVDSRIESRLEVTPLLVHTPATTLHPPPSFSRWIPAAFQKWKADISVGSETPAVFGDTAASGEIEATLRVGGVLGKPVPVGRIDLKNVRAFLPFTALNISDGHLDFVEGSPWVPQLDVRATAQTLEYNVQAYAFGPITERRLILRSDPPLSQDSLVALLTTGILPGIYARTGLSLSVVRPLLTQPFGRQLELQNGAEAPSLSQGQPVVSPAAPSRGRFQLWQDLSLTREGDSFSSSSLSYSLRFR